jgi:hypothetical protein
MLLPRSSEVDGATSLVRGDVLWLRREPAADLSVRVERQYEASRRRPGEFAREHRRRRLASHWFL